MSNERMTANPKKGFKGFLLKLAHLSWKTWLIITIVVAILIGGGLFLYHHLTNTYKAPLDRYMDYMNSRSYSMDKEMSVFNGFAESEFRLFEMCHRMTDDYLEERKDDFSDDVEYRKSEYGTNYKYSYAIESKDKLNGKELNEFEDSLQDIAEILQVIIEYTDGFNSKDWEDFADSADLSVTQAKLYIVATKNLYQELKNAEVTEGYELDLNIIIKGSSLDEPEEHEKTMLVYKIDGRWVAEELLQIQLEHRTLQWMPEDMLYDIFYDVYFGMNS